MDGLMEGLIDGLIDNDLEIDPRLLLMLPLGILIDPDALDTALDTELTPPNDFDTLPP
jgi:hypothetical protein